MPEQANEAKSRDERLLALYQKTLVQPRLGTIGSNDFETLSMEYVMMKLYAAKLEQKIVTVLDELHELIPEEMLPKEEQPTGTADPVGAEGQEHAEHRDH